MLEQIIKDMLNDYWEDAKKLKTVINVNGNIFRVYFVKNIGSSKNLLGTTSHKDIFVVNSLDYKTKTEVLFHEYMHAIAISIDPSYNAEEWIRKTQKEFYGSINYKPNIQLD